MDKLELAVEELLLDHENPRIGSVATQAEALRSIIELDHRHFRTMMESIRDHGIDPGESFYVIQSEDEVDSVVVDGNRRLAAIKVLREPNLLQNLGLSQSFKARAAKIAEEFDRDALESVSCVLFDDRPAADDWILRRHGRGLEGEARIAWGTLEIQRFQKDRTVLDIIDFVARNSEHSDERWGQILEAIEKRPSALRRFIESKHVRKLLGLSVSEEGDEKLPEFRVKPEDALAVFDQIFCDIADGEIDTRTHNKSEKIEEYIEDLPVKVGPAKEGTGTQFRKAAITGPGTRPRQVKTALKKAAAKKTRVKPPRATLAPSKVEFSDPPSEKGKRLVYEASKLKLKETPLAGAFLLRAFVEHALQVYFQAHNLPTHNKKGQEHDLKQRTAHVIDHLIRTGTATKANLHGAERVLTQSKHPASIQALNDYHHNRFHIPSGDDLRSAWDSCEALFVAIFGSKA